jgi:hypothetical protein
MRGIFRIKNQESFPDGNRQEFAIGANEVRHSSAGTQI